MSEEKKFYTIKEATDMLGISEKELIRFIEEKKAPEHIKYADLEVREAGFILKHQEELLSMMAGRCAWKYSMI